jgi:hypothetical protein
MKARCFLLLPSLLLSLVYLPACGAPATPPRQLLSVTITPSTATAQGAGVQFVATGTYNRALHGDAADGELGNYRFSQGLGHHN